MTPRLTVVVPIYNVEDYLDDCLRSLAGQTMADSEIVMVNDGSTDGSARIARRFADQDARFRLVEQANAGLGAARNTGVRHARGEFLTFVDSDDVVPDDAYERMLAALDRSGSDFVTGNVLRLGPGGALVQAPMFRKPMATERSGTRITRDWVLLGDRIACNKVFRKSFWDRHSFAFPSGVLYEDIAVVLPAYFLADGVDVLSGPVYHWRTRDGSITAKRAVPKGIRDRVTAVSSVSDFLAERLRTGVDSDSGGDIGSASAIDWADARRRYHQHVLSGDLWLFIEALPDGDANFHESFLAHANSFAATVDQSVFDALPLHLRVKWHLIRERRMPELLALLAHEKADPGAFGVRGLRRSRAEYPVLTGGLPRAVATLKPKELPVTSHLTEAVWRDGRLHLKGYAYVRNVPADARRKSVKAAWLRTGKRRVLPLRTRTVRMPAATYESKQGLHAYDWAGFETVVDPRRLTRSRGSGSARTVWKLEMGVFGAGRLRRAPLRLTGSAGAPAVPAVHYVDDTTRVVPALSGNKLELRVEPVHALLTGHVKNTDAVDAVRIEGLLHSMSAPPTGLAVQNWYTKDVHEVPLRLGGGTFTADVPLAVFGDPTARRQATVPWGVHLVRANGSRFAVAARGAVRPGHYGLGDGRELYVTANAAGDLVLSDQTEQPVVDTVDWTADGELILEGSQPALRSAELVLKHSGHREENVFPLDTLPDGRFRTALRPGAVQGLHGVRQLAEGRWLLYVREPGESDPERYTALRVQPARHHTLPLVRTLDGREFTLDRHRQDTLQLHSGSVLPEQDRGAYRQQRLRSRYTTVRSAGPLRDAVLYSSFDGRQYSDSPRAIHEELLRRRAPVEHLWVVRDRQVTLPAGARAVELHSADWYEALARSRCVVSNTHLPEWFERADGQYVVQTWHGTPLKRIGRDLTGTAHADEAYIATLSRRAAQWSVLVSPNRFSTPVMRRAFGYEGTVLESGYPRNDLLHAPDRAKVADAVRELLGIPEGKRVILYAPTWREDQPKKGGRYGLDLQLDLEQAAEGLAEDHVLLVRRHYLVGGTVPGPAGFVRDVSRYPDVAELMLISDALVTDYSSLMFDFAQTGRPMYFHAYDLKHYRDTLRGFYFDFESAAPGPLVTDTAALVAALRAPRSPVPAPAYDRFREVFCEWEDGTAAAQVADLMPVGGGA
ncbi:bifunctional glycosyltransferase family 2 protein/CDP-glycerol:glycerophosphate glycerophosphotransferase [Streptomyces sp. NPDC006645]|uniref:bifunctional glycosyltransferase/CDP-glycerol:glycerophosphate glycerophosphotransferase n=1 Tax=unclassified Streptomyces TaxID=2593676 RepID=UPI0033AC2E23